MLPQSRICSPSVEPRQTTTRRRLIWNSSMFLLFLSGLPGPASSQPLQTKNERAIRQQLVGYADARTNGSGERQASFYAEDGDEWELFADQKTIGGSAIANLLN